MTKKALIQLVTLQLFLILISCNGDNEKSPQCFPLSLKILTSTGPEIITYNYTTARKLNTILYSDSRDEMFYDAKQRLVKVDKYQTNFGGEDILKFSYKLEYNDKGLPSTLVISSPNWQAETKQTVTFTHDEKNRLVSVSKDFLSPTTILSITRYEYDANDNVAKVFYRQLANLNEEVLGRENLSFDTKPTFYADMKDLLVYNVYINDYIPNKNNYTKVWIHYMSPGEHLITPETLTMTVAYDERGKIKQSEESSSYPSADEQFHFRELTYTCN